MWGIELAVMFAMIALNSVFAAYEIALASIPAERLSRLSREGKGGARVALWMKQHIEVSLAAVQLGITLVGAIAAATGGAGAAQRIAPWLRDAGMSRWASEFASIAIVVLPLTLASILFGELVPKVFALRRNERVCLRLSPVMRMFAFSVWPVVRTFEVAVTGVLAWSERRKGPRREATKGSPEAELQQLLSSAALARTSRLIGPREEGIILGAARMARHPVREAMVPAERMCLLTAEDRVEDCLTHAEMHTRYPVTAVPGEPQAILGYVNVKDLRLVAPDRTLRTLLRPLPQFPADLPISIALESLIRERTHIALVRDAGRVVGMITLEDIIEELVGDIQDEYDLLPAHVTPAAGGLLVGGGASLERLAELGLAIEGEGEIHLAAWVARKLGRAPEEGDVVEAKGANVTVKKVRRGRLVEAHVRSTSSSTPR